MHALRVDQAFIKPHPKTGIATMFNRGDLITDRDMIEAIKASHDHHCTPTVVPDDPSSAAPESTVEE